VKPVFIAFALAIMPGCTLMSVKPAAGAPCQFSPLPPAPIVRYSVAGNVVSMDAGQWAKVRDAYDSLRNLYVQNAARCAEN
jgi:hypothetical protein